GQRVNSKHRNADASARANTPNGDASTGKSSRGCQRKDKHTDRRRQHTKKTNTPDASAAKPKTTPNRKRPAEHHFPMAEV
ncbi:hypothetical protein, partial [Paraburkholderia hospita]|uniref:hypothetical protein n=1 Tax=Paraburkholderia hospita TaxID=169430 RepID=UPI001A99A67A